MLPLKLVLIGIPVVLAPLVALTSTSHAASIDPICGSCRPKVLVKQNSTCFAVGFMVRAWSEDECEEDTSGECIAMGADVCGASVDVMITWSIGANSSCTPGNPASTVNRKVGDVAYGVPVDEPWLGCGGVGQWVVNEQFSQANCNGNRVCFVSVKVDCTKCNQGAGG